MKRLNIEWNVPNNIDFKPTLKRFQRYLEDRGRRDSTIKGYVGNVERYLKFAGTDHPSEIDRNKFRDELHNAKVSRSTLNQYGYAIKAYHSMLGEDIPYTRLKLNNLIPYYFTSDEVLKIFSVCTNLKHYAMLNLIFYGTLRVSELCAIDDIDINFKDLTVRITEGKCGREGIVYISNECATVLKRYLEFRPPLTIDNRQPLFYTDYGQRWERTEVSRMFARYKLKAGIEKRGGIHVFSRHTPATLLISNGCDLRTVKEILRHTDIRSTLRYAHVADHTKRERYDAYLVL